MDYWTEESPEIVLHIYGQFGFFIKVQRHVSGNRARGIERTYTKQTDFIPHIRQKNQLKFDNRPNFEAEKYKSFRDTQGENLHVLLGRYFLIYYLKSTICEREILIN